MHSKEAWQRRCSALVQRAERFKSTYRSAFGTAMPERSASAPRALFISGAPPRIRGVRRSIRPHLAYST